MDRRFPFVLAAAGLSLGSVVQAAGVVQVSFVKPETFADVRDQAFSRERNLDAVKQVIAAAATPYVADGQTLKVEVLDVDLAGEPKPGARPNDLRVLRGRADWPRITLRWTLESPGQAPKQGEAVVQDMSYLQRLPLVLPSSPLPYERRMLDEWFRTTFGAAKVN